MAVTAINRILNIDDVTTDQTIWMLDVLLHIFTYYCALLHS